VAIPSNVEVHSNTLDRNADGFGLRRDKLGSGSHGRHLAKNI
jgi:hypothetical protein